MISLEFDPISRRQKPLQKEEAMRNLTMCFSISANESLNGCMLNLRTKEKKNRKKKRVLRYISKRPTLSLWQQIAGWPNNSAEASIVRIDSRMGDRSNSPKGFISLGIIFPLYVMHRTKNIRPYLCNRLHQKPSLFLCLPRTP